MIVIKNWGAAVLLLVRAILLYAQCRPWQENSYRKTKGVSHTIQKWLLFFTIDGIIGCMKVKLYVGIDIGGTKIAAGLVTPSGKIIGRAKAPTPKNASPAKIIRIISDLLEEMLDSCDCQKKGLAGIGIGVPGIVDTEKGAIIRTPNMNLSGFKLQSRLENKFRVPIALGNDVNLGVLGEKWLGAARKAHNVVGLFIGTGLGGGIIINDRLLAGCHGAAAEIGHMTIDVDGPKCSCGNQGCLEAFVGRWAIERDIKKSIAQGKKTIVTKLIEGKIKSIKSRILHKALEKHDFVVTAIMSKASNRLGIACVSMRHIFDPEIIVVGGGVIEACGDFMVPIVKKILLQDKFFSKLGDCQLVASQLKDDAIILGAVALIRQQV